MTHGSFLEAVFLLLAVPSSTYGQQRHEAISTCSWDCEHDSGSTLLQRQQLDGSRDKLADAVSVGISNELQKIGPLVEPLFEQALEENLEDVAAVAHRSSSLLQSTLDVTEVKDNASDIEQFNNQSQENPDEAEKASEEEEEGNMLVNITSAVLVLLIVLVVGAVIFFVCLGWWTPSGNGEAPDTYPELHEVWTMRAMPAMNPARKGKAGKAASGAPEKGTSCVRFAETASSQGDQTQHAGPSPSSSARSSVDLQPPSPMLRPHVPSGPARVDFQSVWTSAVPEDGYSDLVLQACHSDRVFQARNGDGQTGDLTPAESSQVTFEREQSLPALQLPEGGYAHPVFKVSNSDRRRQRWENQRRITRSR